MLTEQETIQLSQSLSKDGWVPAGDLHDLPYVVIKSTSDLLKIPSKQGAYWIVTNEPVEHSMHNRSFPAKIKEEKNESEIIYNGVAGNIRGRASVHLLREKCEGMSGISVDLFTGSAPPRSHVKKAFVAGRGKVPYINGTLVSAKEDLHKMNLSQKEKDYVSQSNNEQIFLWNGINVSWEKHVNHEWRVYYYVCDHSMSSHVEIKWRERNGNPKLNSYKAGR